MSNIIKFGISSNSSRTNLMNSIIMSKNIMSKNKLDCLILLKIFWHFHSQKLLTLNGITSRSFIENLLNPNLSLGKNQIV